MLSSETLSPETSLQSLGVQISKYSQSVCCHGSYNVGHARDATTEIYKYIKALYYTFYSPNKSCLKKLSLQDEERGQYEAILKSCSLSKFLFTNGYGVFKPGETMISLPLEIFISREVIGFVNRLYPLAEKFKFNQLKAEDLCPYFSLLLSFDVVDEEKRQNFARFMHKASEEIAFIQLYEKGIEFKEEDKKQLFLRKTFRDVRNEGFYFGVGNCGLMADVAFADAIYQDHTYPITYLRFVCEGNPKADVLNCIALGNWPDPGCMIIAPWLKNNCVFVWNGTIENTPRITQVLKSFNAFKVLCRISPAEKEEVKLDLKKMGYEQWLASDTRKRNLAKIQNCAEAFLQNVAEISGVHTNKPGVSNTGL